jgi:hypothetical protein
VKYTLYKNNEKQDGVLVENSMDWVFPPLIIKIESLENCVKSYVNDGTIPIVISIILERKATYIE